MKPGDCGEKRKFKRLELSFPVSIKCVGDDRKEIPLEGVIVNVSFSGAYIIDIDNNIKLKAKDCIHISLSVPRDETRDFPFSRFAGSAEVIRVDKQGLALEFGKDMSRLFVAN